MFKLFVQINTIIAPQPLYLLDFNAMAAPFVNAYIQV